MNETRHKPGRTSVMVEWAPRDMQPPAQFSQLDEQAAQLSSERQRRDVNHMACTLRDAGAIRQILIIIRRDGRVQRNDAAGDVAVLVLPGEMAVAVEGAEYVLGSGDLLNLAPGLPHDLHAWRESSVLLTIAPARQ